MKRAALLLIVAVLVGCGSSLMVPQADRGVLEQEVQKQEELAKTVLEPWSSSLVLDSSEVWLARLLAVYYSLGRAAAGLLEAQDVKKRGGLGFWVEPVILRGSKLHYVLVRHGFVKEDACEAVVVAVARGSAAERAGLKPGDVVVEVNGVDFTAIPFDWMPGVRFSEKWSRVNAVLTQASTRLDRDVRMRVLRVGDGAVRELSFVFRPDAVVEYSVKYTPDPVINAWTDGKHIYVTDGLLRWVKDETQLAAVIGHELSHILLGHVQKTKLRAVIGGLVGLVFDAALAGSGVNTEGMFSKVGAGVGALTFSKQEEREADYMMLYLLARGGFDFKKAPEVFRELAVVSPESIRGGYMSTHPGTAERYVLLQQAADEIEKELRSGRGRDELQPKRKTEVRGG